MIDFLIKSSISLLALLFFYHLILEKEKMHQFNRFYLLFGIAFSFVVPFITIEIITETVAPIQQTYAYVAQKNINVPVIVATKTIDYKPIILWALYGLVTSMLLFRYIRNILKIASNIKSNPIVEYKNAKLVLLKEQTSPHTFLNYIFLNKTDYQNSKINEELYTHELIHVNQKHTLDVLLVEAVKTVFWFNPLFIFYKKAIQLNHEFLADEKVVTAYDNVPFYQNLLLAHANTNSTFALTSNLNYSITKKRFIMMTKTVSKTKVLLFKIALLPLFSGLIYFMCAESVAQVTTTTIPKKKNDNIVHSNVIPTPSWNVSAVKNENLPTENTTNLNFVKTVSVVKKENPPAEETELTINYDYDLKGAKIDEAALKKSLAKLGDYVVSTYKSLKGTDKKDEIVTLRFFLKRDGNLDDVTAFMGRGTETENKLISILKSSPKSIFENNYGEADWDQILIQMDFKPKDIEEIMAKQNGISGKVAIGFPILKEN